MAFVTHRFLREGRLLSNLNHPRLPRCFRVLELPRPALVLERLVVPPWSRCPPCRGTRRFACSRVSGPMTWRRRRIASLARRGWWLLPLPRRRKSHDARWRRGGRRLGSVQLRRCVA